MAKSVIEAGIDIGSSQTVVIIGSREESNGGAVTVLGAAQVPCRGLKGGVVVNIPESKVAVTQAVEQAEEQTKETIEGVLVGIRGPHIETFNHRGAITISRTDREITSEDVEQVITNAKAIQLSSDREILHTVPQDFSVDKQSGVEDPVGMEGSHLAVDVHIAVASSSHISNVMKSINSSGFNCDDLIYGVLAAGDCVVSDEEKDLGVALIDIGGQTTNIAVYLDGSVRFARELPIGGELVTKDISYGLKTSFSHAQELKEKYGRAMTSLLSGNEMFEFLAVDGHTKKEVSCQMLVGIIQSRVEEIFEWVGKELHNSNYAEMIPGGIVLTGGCAKLPGIDKLAEEIFKVNVHIGRPIEVEGPPEIVYDPTYATAIGLLKFKHLGEWARSSRIGPRAPSMIGKFKSWINDLI